MKLYYGTTSPYVRKVVVSAHECGLHDRIERIETFPWETGTEYGSVNPVGKVPALITDDGQVLYDSPVIVEYLDSLHDGPKLIPASGPERFECLRIAALADGMMDAVILLFSELTRRPKELHWDYWDKRMRGTVARSLDALEKDAVNFNPDQPDMAQIATAVGVGWIDFRTDTINVDWKSGHPNLVAWFEKIAQRPSMTGSVPVAH